MATIDLIVLGILKKAPMGAYDIQKFVEYRNISKWVKLSTPSTVSYTHLDVYKRQYCRCRFAILNPELTSTLPDYQTQSGCVDILSHTMERYFNQSTNMEMTDGISEALLRTVMKNSLILKTDPQNSDDRAEVMWASRLSHNGLTGCGTDGGDWASHQLEHELGGMFDVAHGAGLAAVWGTWARYVCKDRLDRFAKFAENVLFVPHSEDLEQTALLGLSLIHICPNSSQWKPQSALYGLSISNAFLTFPMLTVGNRSPFGQVNPLNAATPQ